MSKQLSLAYKIGCFHCASCVIVGMAGVSVPNTSGRKDCLYRGIMYHFMNGVGMILSSLLPSAGSSFILSYHIVVVSASYFFQSAILFFTIPLYHRAITGSKNLSTILPPFGGISMAIGWIYLASTATQ